MNPIFVTLIVAVAVVSAHLTALRAGSVIMDNSNSDSYPVTYTGYFNIPSGSPPDNVTLSADGYIPSPKSPGETFPLLVFPASWGIKQTEYKPKIQALAQKGYVTVEYQERGFYKSTGEIGTAGPDDRTDIRNLLDWLLANKKFPINKQKIAFLGISYGGGMSLMAAGADERVTTICAMSGWADLLDGFYFQRTPNKAATDMLLLMAHIAGRPPASLGGFQQDLLWHRNMAHVLDWARDRSAGPLFLNSVFNPRKVPLFISNNYIDRLFYPQGMLDFFAALDYPEKFMMLNHGAHALAEGAGAQNKPDVVWARAEQWIDFYLKGIGSPPSGMEWQAGDGSVTTEEYLPMSQYPDPKRTVMLTYHFTPRDAKANVGGLVREPPADPPATVDTIGFTFSPPLVPSSGLQDLGWTYGLNPVTHKINTLNPKESIVYLSEPLEADIQICGTPLMNLSLSGLPANGNWQVYGYLYEVTRCKLFNTLNGAMLSDYTYTRYADDVSNTKNSECAEGGADGCAASGTTATTIVDTEWRTLCNTVKAGSQIGVGFALYADLYTQANNASDFSLGLSYNVGQPSITLPLYKP